MVPLNDEVMMINLMMVLDLPVIVVARSGLGTINHTLLTLEALTHRGLKVLGVVMNGEPNKENRKAIEHFGKVKVLAEVPRFDEPMGENLRFWARHNRSSFDAVGNEPIYEFISTRP
jgi:dethiobiotin synthetase/malonyl-CoA O-methyltransferase